MFRNSLLLLLLSVCGLTAGGKPQLRVCILAEHAPTSFVQVSAIAGDKRSVDFDLTASYLSNPVEVPGRVFQLRRKLPDTVIANVQLPDTGDNFVLMIIPEKNESYNAIVITTDEDSGFNAGCFYLYNHSDETVIGHIGASQFAISAGKGQIIKPEDGGDKKSFDVAFGLRQKISNHAFRTTPWSVKTGVNAGSKHSYNQTIMNYFGDRNFLNAAGKRLIGKPESAPNETLYDVVFGKNQDSSNRVFSTTRWPVDNRLRSYVFFIKNPVSGRLDCRAVDEFVPRPETQQKQTKP